MFLFLGGNVTVDDRSVIGIFNIEECTVSGITNEHLRVRQKQGKIVNVSEDLPKSLVVCEDKSYISNVSNLTINKRARKGWF